MPGKIFSPQWHRTEGVFCIRKLLIFYQFFRIYLQIIILRFQILFNIVKDRKKKATIREDRCCIYTVVLSAKAGFTFERNASCENEAIV